MATSHSSILVTGATGNAGGALLAELARTGASVRAAARNPRGPGQVRFDYSDPSTYASALEGVDRVFVIPLPEVAPHHAMLPFLEAAARSVRKIVLMTAMGAQYDPDGSLRRMELAVERSGVPFAILRPNWFMDNFHTWWGPAIRETGVIALPAAGAKTSLIDARDIARSAAVLLQSDAFDGQAFTVTGPEALTYAEAAETLSQAAGVTIRYDPVSDDAFIASLRAAGAPEELSRHLAALFGFVRQGAVAEISPAVEQITGQPPGDLNSYARIHAAALVKNSA